MGEFKAEKPAVHGFLEFRLDHRGVPEQAPLPFPALVDEGFDFVRALI
jgi:hypothetical protein